MSAHTPAAPPPAPPDHDLPEVEGLPPCAMLPRVPPALPGPPGLLLHLGDGRRLQVRGRHGEEVVTATCEAAPLWLGVTTPAPGREDVDGPAGIRPWIAAPRGAGPPVRPDGRVFGRDE